MPSHYGRPLPFTALTTLDALSFGREIITLTILLKVRTALRVVQYPPPTYTQLPSQPIVP